MRPGTWPWLAAAELRMTWRGFSGGYFWLLTVGGGLLWIAMHWAAIATMPSGYPLIAGMLQVPVFAGGMMWLAVSLMVSQAMVHSITALMDSGRLDLLLSSPLPQRAVFMTRGLEIAVSLALLPAYALLPLAHAGLFTGHPGLMGIYPVLVSGALFCTAAGLMITMTLVRLLGARRARTAGQVLAALVGVAFFLAFQIPNSLSPGAKKAAGLWIMSQLNSGWALGPQSPLWWPLRAATGELLPLLAVTAAGIFSFRLTIDLAYARFVGGTQESFAAARPAAAPSAGTPVFRAGLTRVLLAKEWKLVLRDMQVISQTLVQLLYLVPLLLAGFKHGPKNPYIIPAIVAAAAMLAGNLAWLTVSAEDAPELVSTSPVPVGRLMKVKAAAAALPLLALLLPLSLWWLTRSAPQAAVLMLCGTGAVVSAALIQLWNPCSGKRQELKYRNKSLGGAGIIEMGSTVSWIAATVCAGMYREWLPYALAACAVMLLAGWHAGRGAREKVWGRA